MQAIYKVINMKQVSCPRAADPSICRALESSWEWHKIEKGNFKFIKKKIRLL